MVPISEKKLQPVIERSLQLLREQIEKTYSMPLRTPKDFNQLVKSIFDRTHEMVNATTLKRLYGYLEDVRCPRGSTLNILCHYVGYASWEAFVSKQEGNAKIESSIVVSDYLYSDELYVGERLRILWQPDRELVVECIDQEQFTIIEAVNSKLKAGNTFRCSLFIQQEPLYLTDVTGMADTPTNYICGTVNGITFSVL